MGSLVSEESGLRDPSVPSVDRALNLIELLASTSAGLNLSMISRKLNIPKSSAYYLVTTLTKRNLVRRDPEGRVYSLGTLAPSFAKIGRAESALKKFCGPYIQSLSSRLGMTAQLGIREGAEARIIDRSEMPGPRLDSWVGRHFDLHCTAIGKALISYLPDSEVENLFKTRGLPKHNENTVSSLDVLKSHLAETRRRGYAMDDEEHELGVRCVASPIFNHSAGVIGGICVFTPANRLPRPEMPGVGVEVMKTARDLSRAFNDSPLEVQRVLRRWESDARPDIDA